ncbi:type VI secretion system Vgr family protein [Alloalcanivorax xenomutans]|uniref:type VI secretion system Vgr family protein n=1 Tax=Alloalcanivorax xenomutans TaxID=1094342 RepID=UPI001F44DEF5|nr:type VI secretion system Vgr family protein [Alloalcanivorax xenomutans]MCE7521976.1 type VI secretion system tip protein VgrG [Alloalcanivorax xenomutans]
MTDPFSLGRDILAALATPLQDQRLIEIDAAADGLVVERFQGREEVCGEYKFTIDCFITGPDRRNEDVGGVLKGRPMTLSLRRPDGGWRRWHGICVDTHQYVDMDGLPRCELTLETQTFWLSERLNSEIFPQCSVQDVIERIISEYPELAVRFDLLDPLPQRPMITQYRENHWEFCLRLMAEYGLAWRFEHRQDGQEAEDGGPPVTLVIFDHHARLPEGMPLDFHNDHAEESRPSVTRFTDGSRLTPNAVQVASWHSGKVRTVTGRAEATDPDGLPVREIYWHREDTRFDSAAQAEQTAGHHLDALRVLSRVHRGESRVRTLATGEAFTLSGHPRCHEGPYVALVVEHAAVNNLGHAGQLLGDDTLKAGQYRNAFLAIPATTPIAPLPRPKPEVGGPLLARVVGGPGDAVTSNRDHQVRIQYSWQRGESPNPGGLDDTGSASPGHAPNDASSGIWVSVMEAQAGPNWGANFLPRVGSEVIVEFRQGDIDKPVIIGQLNNGEIKPPFGMAHEDGANHAGTVSGFQTREQDGQGEHSHTWQRFMMDDTPRQVSLRLDTSLAKSGLGLGYLVKYNQTQRGELHGQGWELATQAWTTIRVGLGLLVSATARPRGQGTQMEMNEAVAQLKGAERTAQALHDAATAAGAPGLAGNAAQTAFREALDPQVNGRYTAPVAGQSPFKPKPGSREDSDQPVETFADPKLVLEGPDHIVLNSDKSAVAMAGEHLHITTQSDGHIAAGDNLAFASGGSAGLFAQKGPLKVISENGPVSLQANGGPLELLADQSVTVTSSEGKVSVLAKEKITLQSGEVEIVLDGANIFFRCPGTFTIKGSIKALEPGQAGSVGIPSTPSGTSRLASLAKTAAAAFSANPSAALSQLADTAAPKASAPDALEITYRWPNGKPVEDVPYSLNETEEAEETPSAPTPPPGTTTTTAPSPPRASGATPKNAVRSGTVSTGEAREEQLDTVVDVRIGPGQELDDEMAALHDEIKATLSEIIEAEKKEAAEIEKEWEESGLPGKAWKLWRSTQWAAWRGAWDGAVGLLEFTSNVMAFAPHNLLTRAARNAWETAREEGESDTEFRQRFLENFSEDNKNHLVDALGFDPSSISREQLAEAWETATLIMEDEESRQLILDFVTDWYDAQDALEKLELSNYVAGAVAFEILLGILFAAATGGAGNVAQVGSKLRHLSFLKKLQSPFQKLGLLLKKKRLRRDHKKKKGGQRIEEETALPETLDIRQALRRLPYPKTLQEAREHLLLARSYIKRYGYSPMFTDAELEELVKSGKAASERFHVRIMDANYLNGQDGSHLGGGLGRVMETPNGAGAKYWSTTWEQILDVDTDPKLIHQKLGLEGAYDQKRKYALVIIDTEKAAPLTGNASIVPTFKELGRFASDELSSIFPNNVVEQVLTPDFQQFYANHYKMAMQRKFIEGQWDTDGWSHYLRQADIDGDSEDLLSKRFDMHDRLGNNEDFEGTGLTKNSIPDSPNQSGAFETFNFERKGIENEITLAKLKENDAIEIIEGMTEIATQ